MLHPLKMKELSKIYRPMRGSWNLNFPFRSISTMVVMSTAEVEPLDTLEVVRFAADPPVVAFDAVVVADKFPVIMVVVFPPVVATVVV